MAKFYFNLRGEGQNFDDCDGSHYASLAEAERAALRTAHLMQLDTEDDTMGRRWFEILDDSHRIQAIVPLSAAKLVEAA
jgi:hypothetical protein